MHITIRVTPFRQYITIIRYDIYVTVHLLFGWQHSGRTPQNTTEKNEFKQLIKRLAIDFSSETNFQEAVQESYRAYAKKEIPSGLLELMQRYRFDSDHQEIGDNDNKDASNPSVAIDEFR